MPNMSLTKNPMPEQEPLVRNKNFEEVATGYTRETAIDEAQRCLNCKNKPCISGCPVNVRIPEFIAKVAEGDFDTAYDIITSTNALPAVCGRVCPQESQCEGKCVRGIKGESVGIGRLERFVADNHIAKCGLDGTGCMTLPEKNGHRVAVVGSGPAGLTCAGDLARMGYDVTIFEAFHKAGGVLVYGIPEFRLPKSIVQGEIDNLVAMGVKLVTNAVIGRAMSVDELFSEGFEAVFIGTGAGLPMFMHIPGVKSGLNIRLDDPTELGGDFVSAAVAAIEEYPMPCVIVEMGTAIAMGILDSAGSYIGGIICPGPMVSQIALARGAAQLSNVSITPTPQVICKNTDACMQSGIVHGSAAMIDGLLERVESELGQSVTTLATGDWADTLVPHCRRKMIVDKELLTRGMCMIYRKNHKG